MNSSLSRRDVVWGYAAQLLNIAAGLILLPIIVRFLTQDEVGLWFVFLALASLAQLLEFGFLPTITRNAAYIYAGAQELHPEGLKPVDKQGDINYKLLTDLFAAARHIYLYVAIAAALVMFGAGTFYIYSLLPSGYEVNAAIAGWVTFSAGYVLNFYFGYYNGMLQGRGDITLSNKVIVTSRLVMVLLGAILLIKGYGLLGLGVASFVSAIAGRFLAYRYFFTAHRPETAQLSKRTGDAKTLIWVLWHNASRFGLVNLGAFLIARANLLIASSVLGLGVAGSYGMSLQLLLSLAGVASMFAHLQLPRMNALQAHGKLDSLRGTYGLTVLSSWFMYALGATVLLTMGPATLELIGSNTTLLNPVILTCLVVIVALEMNHSIGAAYLTTLNYIPFVGAALWSGVAIIIVGYILVTQTSLGLWGLIIAQGVVQASYNNWKWPKEASKHLGCGFPALLRFGLIEMKAIINAKAH